MAFSIDPTGRYFKHCAFKSFEYQLTADHCTPSPGYQNEIHIFTPTHAPTKGGGDSGGGSVGGGGNGCVCCCCGTAAGGGGSFCRTANGFRFLLSSGFLRLISEDTRLLGILVLYLYLRPNTSESDRLRASK